MASTKAKKKIETAKDLEPVLEPVKEIKPPVTDKVLHISQLRSIEVCERDVQNARLVMAVEEQALQNLILQSKYLGLAIEKQRALVDSKSKSYELEKSRYELIAKDILALHGIEGADRFAYDPDTGKIIL